MKTFNELKVGDKIKTNLSGMAIVIEIGCYGGKMVKLKCDKPKWSCPYFYETELDFKQQEQ